jgi:methylglyoxal synthase
MPGVKEEVRIVAKLNGSLIYVVAIVIVGLATGLAVVRLSGQPGTEQTIGAVIAFGTLLVKSFFDSMATARNAAVLKETLQRVAVVDNRLAVADIKLDVADIKLDGVHAAVDGINKAALVNQAKVSDAAGFNRGVAETAAAAAAVVGGETQNLASLREVAP